MQKMEDMDSLNHNSWSCQGDFPWRAGYWWVARARGLKQCWWLFTFCNAWQGCENLIMVWILWGLIVPVRAWVHGKCLRRFNRTGVLHLASLSCAMVPSSRSGSWMIIQRLTNMGGKRPCCWSEGICTYVDALIPVPARWREHSAAIRWARPRRLKRVCALDKLSDQGWWNC